MIVSCLLSIFSSSIYPPMVAKDIFFSEQGQKEASFSTTGLC